MIQYKQSQAALIEIIFLAVLISSITGYLISTNSSEQQISNVKPTQTNFGVHNLLLNSNSNMYVKDLVQNNVSMSNSAWNSSFNTLNSIYQGNLILLNANLSILDTKESCSISSLNTKLFTIPILIYNTTTEEIEDMKFLQYEICRLKQ